MGEERDRRGEDRKGTQTAVTRRETVERWQHQEETVNVKEISSRTGERIQGDSGRSCVVVCREACLRENGACVQPLRDRGDRDAKRCGRAGGVVILLLNAR